MNLDYDTVQEKYGTSSHCGGRAILCKQTPSFAATPSGERHPEYVIIDAENESIITGAEDPARAQGIAEGFDRAHNTGVQPSVTGITQ